MKGDRWERKGEGGEEKEINRRTERVYLVAERVYLVGEGGEGAGRRGRRVKVGGRGEGGVVGGRVREEWPHQRKRKKGGGCWGVVGDGSKLGDRSGEIKWEGKGDGQKKWKNGGRHVGDPQLPLNWGGGREKKWRRKGLKREVWLGVRGSRKKKPW